MSELYNNQPTARLRQQVDCMKQMLIILFACQLAGGTNLLAGEPRPELLAAYVPPSILWEANDSLTAPPGSLALTESQNWRVTSPRIRGLSTGQRWEAFETEFGITDEDYSWFKGSLQTAKYQLDKTVFAMDDFVTALEDTFRFEYDLRAGTGSFGTDSRVQRQPADPRRNARLRSDIDLHPFSGRAFIGLRLVVPFGD